MLPLEERERIGKDIPDALGRSEYPGGRDCSIYEIGRWFQGHPHSFFRRIIRMSEGSIETGRPGSYEYKYEVSEECHQANPDEYPYLDHAT